MRTPIGKVSWLSLLLALLVIGTIVAGMLLPGRTGTIIQVIGWIALAIGIIFEVGIRTTPIGNYDGDDRRPW